MMESKEKSTPVRLETCKNLKFAYSPSIGGAPKAFPYP